MMRQRRRKANQQDGETPPDHEPDQGSSSETSEPQSEKHHRKHVQFDMCHVLEKRTQVDGKRVLSDERQSGRTHSNREDAIAQQSEGTAD